MANTAGKRILPLPEFLTGGEQYKIMESKEAAGHVCTDMINRVMAVPTGDTPIGRMGRLHEMAHVAITPADGIQRAAYQGIKPDYINVAEDMRLNHYLTNNNFRLEKSFSEKLLNHTAEGFELNEDIKGATLFAVASHSLPEYKDFILSLDKLREKVEHYVENCCYYLRDGNAFGNSIDVARYLQALFESQPRVKPAEDEDERDVDYLKTVYPIASDNPDLEWGRMKVLKPALPITLPEHRLTRRVTPKEYGDRLMFPARLEDDDKIFGNMRRVAKGTVLVDCSGSMSLSNEDIESMVKAVPGVTVAMYSGSGGEGYLDVVAGKGRMTNNLYFHGGNVVDGPALDWLAQQTKPRVWVSDAFVTGVGDDYSSKLLQQALDIVERASITRVHYPSSVVKALKGGKKD